MKSMTDDPRIRHQAVLGAVVLLALPWVARADCSYDLNGVGYGDTCQHENTQGSGGYRTAAPNNNYYYQQQMIRARMAQQQAIARQQAETARENMLRERQIERQRLARLAAEAQATAAAKAKFLRERDEAAASLKGGACCDGGSGDDLGLKMGPGSTEFGRAPSSPHLPRSGAIGSNDGTALGQLKAEAGASVRSREAGNQEGGSELAGATFDRGGGFAQAAPSGLVNTPSAKPVSERVARDPTYRRLSADMARARENVAADHKQLDRLREDQAAAHDELTRQKTQIEIAKITDHMETAESRAASDEVNRHKRAKEIENVYETAGPPSSTQRGHP